ncbi:MAG: HalOD1 output domain-containing protein [Haloplanus sp.]
MSATGDGSATTKMETASHRVDIDWSRREPVSFAVQGALSQVEDCAPTEIDPLADYVDPDALEAFFTGEESELASRSVTFEYDGHTVYVDGAGYVLVD